MSGPFDRILITGASGSGTTTFGKHLAEKLVVPLIDVDDIFWVRTDPPFTVVREREERISLLKETLRTMDRWVMSGCLFDWGDFIKPIVDRVIWLDIPSEVRLARLKARERLRFGSRIDPGGDMHAQHREFMDWAGSYDSGGLDMRSRVRHTQWLADIADKTLVVEDALTLDELLRLIET